jgi:hypothetical protein
VTGEENNRAGTVVQRHLADMAIGRGISGFQITLSPIMLLTGKEESVIKNA